MNDSRDLANVYDEHTIVDTFYRYWQNSDLLTLLSRYLGNVEGEVHLDIGFSGRLGLFSCLASTTYAINPSTTQLAIGRSLLPRIVSFFHRAKPHLEKRRFPLRTALDAFPWLGQCSTVARRKMVRDLVMQVRAIVSANKTPRECQLVTRAEYFAPNMSDVEDDLFHSIAMIDVLPHVDNIVPIFAEISRVLRREGHVVVSYFPFARKGEVRSKRFRCVDEIFSVLAQEYGIEPESVCDRQQHEVYP